MKKSETFADNTAKTFLVFCLFYALGHLLTFELIYYEPKFLGHSIGDSSWEFLPYAVLIFSLDIVGACLGAGLLYRSRIAYRSFLVFLIFAMGVLTCSWIEIIFREINPSQKDQADWRDYPVQHVLMTGVGVAWDLALGVLLFWVWTRFRANPIRSLFKERNR